MVKFSQKVIEWSFYALFLLVPLVFNAASSELFEYNKMMLTYGLTIIIVAAWILKGVKNFHRTPLDIPIGLYLVSHILSTIFSLDPHVSFWGYYSRFHEGLLATISYILLYYAAVSNLDKTHVIKILKVSLISAVIVSIYGALEHFGASPSCLFITGNFDVSCWVQDVQGRVFATLGQPNWMAAYLDVLILVSLGFFTRSDLKKVRPFMLLPLLFLAALYFTKSRSGFIGLAAGIFVFTVFILKINFRLKIGICILVFIVGSLYGWHRYQTLPPPGPGVTDSEAIRKPVWEGAVKVWQRYPILGSGVETFAYSYYLDRPAEHNLLSEWDFLYNKAHNEYLNILSTTGTLGFLSYLSLLGGTLWILRRNPSLLAAYTTILVTNFFGFSVVIIGLYFFLIPAFNEILKD
jgi:putative inorganic carbon (HCO3(-)) transporter